MTLANLLSQGVYGSREPRLVLPLLQDLQGLIDRHARGHHDLQLAAEQHQFLRGTGELFHPGVAATLAL
jgi:hypothetical protein